MMSDGRFSHVEGLVPLVLTHRDGSKERTQASNWSIFQTVGPGSTTGGPRFRTRDVTFGIAARAQNDTKTTAW